MMMNRSLRFFSPLAPHQPSLIRRFSLRTRAAHMPKEKRAKLGEVLRQAQADLIAVNSFVTSQRLVTTLDSQASYRTLASDLQEALKRVDELIVACGARPSLVHPLLNLSFLFGGSMTGLIRSGEKNKYVLATMKKVVEDNFDECLRILTEEEIYDEEIRKAIVAIRDGLYHNRQDLYSENESDPQVEKAVEQGFGVMRGVTKFL